MVMLRLERGNETECKEENIELLNGMIYEKPLLDENAVRAARFLYAFFGSHKISLHPLDDAPKPQTPIRLNENTIVKPELCVTRNGATAPTWIVEFATKENEEIVYLAKPAIYRAAGIKEYWVIDTTKKLVCVYDFKQTGLLPTMVSFPQRIKVGCYNDLYISYSDLFKEKTEK